MSNTEEIPSKKQKFGKGGCATCCCCFTATKNDMEDKENDSRLSNLPEEPEAVSAS